MVNSQLIFSENAPAWRYTSHSGAFKVIPMTSAYNATPAGVLNRIREIRNAKGMTLEEVAASINVSWQTLQKYETGKRRVTLDQLAEIAAALGVSLNDLVAGKEKQVPDNLKDLIEFVKSHPRQGQVIISTFEAMREAVITLD